MRNKTFTRLLCLALALMCLVSSAVTAVGATVVNDNLTDKSIEDYKETLNMVSYAEYQAMYFANAAQATKEITALLTDNWVYECDSVIITMTDGVWKMTVLSKDYFETVAEATAAGYAASELYTVEDGRLCAIAETYASLEDALAAKDDNGKAKYKASDLAYVTDEYQGVKAIYTPGRGKVTWTVDLKAEGVTAATLYRIGLDYFPVVARSSAIERELYINGKPVFSEAHALLFSKIWGSYQQGSTTGDTGANLKALVATYTLGGRDDLNAIVAEAEDAGFKANVTYTVAQDQKSITFVQPEYSTVKNSAFVAKYGLRFLATDINNNEIRPTQLQTPEWRNYIISDSDGYTHYYEAVNAEGEKVGTYDSEHFGFVLTPDENGLVKIALDSVNEPMALSTLTLLPYESTYSYADYRKALEKLVGTKNGTSVIKIEAENTNKTSTNVIYPIEDRASALTSPVDPKRMILNTIGTEKWATAGQWVEYSFSVDDSGWYDIYARFKQSYLDGMYVSRALTITTNYESEEAYVAAQNTAAGYYNGLPFSEAAGLRYDYGTDWQVTKLSSTGNLSDESYQLYFQKGVIYTINLKVTFGTMSDTVREIERILNALNQDYLDIIQLTGTTPDDYRDYKFYSMLPETLDSMFAEIDSLTAISQFLREGAGVASTYTGVCDKLVDLLGRMVIKGGDPIAKNLDTFKSYVGSLGTFLSDAKTQPLQLDYLVIQPAEVEAPKASANFFQAFWHEIRGFFWSFFRDYNSMGATEELGENVEAITVWVPYGRDQANVIRNLATNSFTQQYGKSVDLKLVTGGTLLPSILAGMGPDVYHGLGDDTVINYAIRGALLQVEDIDPDNFEDVISNFNEAALTVLRIADADNIMHYYGLPETQSFSMMFVRLDVLQDLGIEIPRTWDDLYVAQSKLQSNNMEIGVTTDYMPFLYQMGGSIWADEGMRINLDSEYGLAAFNKMCDMFTQYSFPYQYDAANRFRTGEMPIILAGYTGLYNQLKVFATELDGCWTFVPVPGTLNEETGKIDNQTMAATAAVVMISGTTNTKDAWDYMCWYTGAEAQIAYANEMVAIIGDSAKHSTANREALASMPWTYDEYIEVSKQFENLSAIENYPGFYFIGRHTNFAFLSAYNDGADPTTELLSYINTINTEITRKRKEFGLETLELGQKLSEKRSNQIRTAIDALKETTSDVAQYQAAIDKAMYGIVNGNIVRLEEAAILFDELLAAKWDKSTKEIMKVNGDIETVPSYYNNVTKQTLEPEKKDGYDVGGYAIKDLSELELIYFIAEALRDTAEALASY